MWILVRMSVCFALIVESIYRAPKVAAVNRNIELDPCICTAYPEALLPRRFGKSKTRMIVSSCLLKSSSEMWNKEECKKNRSDVDKIFRGNQGESGQKSVHDHAINPRRNL